VKPREKIMEDKSKSEKKRDMTALQELGKRLLELSREQVQKIEMPQELQDAILLARTLNSHSALRRQMQYIGVLMRRIDVEPIRQELNEIGKGQKRKAREFQQLELMRDNLVEGDDAVFAEIIDRFPDADIQKLRQIVRAARREKKDDTSPKQSRALFRYLRGLSAKS
jgi:ribosome-associated protein